MAYIYKITNKHNNRSYIGRCSTTPEIRWKQHLYDSKRDRCKDRPLYKAINKYGENSFELEIIEICADECSFDREVYWIERLDTFRHGYNATFGGEGKHYVDYGLVYETYLRTRNCAEVAKILGMDAGWVSVIVRALSNTSKLEHPLPNKKRVNMFTKDGRYIRTFSSCHDAAKYIVKQGFSNSKDPHAASTHICDVCKGKRKMASGFRWEYA